VAVRNLDFIRSMPDIGAKLYETLSDLNAQHQTLAQQVNGSGVSQPAAPASINALTVTGQNGHFNVAITDNNPVYRDVHYWLEHADNPHFVNAHVVHMGQSRNTNLFLGNVTRYFRAYSSYASSPPSTPAYHGTATGAPLPVSGGGAVGGPNFTQSQSSGTGQPGQLLQGPGTEPFRSQNGAPPKR
jgi:hypothetical protein